MYNLCASACPATCASMEGMDDCPNACIEACECPEGTLLNGNTCVQPSQCGCTWDGVYYQVCARLVLIVWKITRIIVLSAYNDYRDLQKRIRF